MGRKQTLERIYDNEGKLIKKQCGKCGELKEVEMFNKRASSKDGLQAKCKDCMKNHREENKDKILEYKKQYDKDNKERILKRQQNYYNDNKEIILKKQKKHYIENKDIILEKQKQYDERNKERKSEYHKQWYEDKTNEAINKIYENYTKNNYPKNDIQYGVIYGVYNKITNRWYIGQTTRSFDIRYNGDFFENKFKYINGNKKELFLGDLEKYGKESFEIYDILDVAFSPLELDEKEVYYIDYYKAYEEGYNSNRGYINSR